MLTDVVIVFCAGVVCKRETVEVVPRDVVFGISEDPAVTEVETGGTSGHRCENKAIRRDVRRD